MKKEYIPFTYRVTCIPTGQHYYGVRWQAGCHPDELWTKYFTSSDKVKALIEEHGKDSFQFEIRRTFPNNPKAAIDWEARVLKKIYLDENWLNQAAFPSIDNRGENNPNWGKPAWNRGKEHSEETRRKIGDGKRGKNIGENHPMYGKEPWNKGKKLSEEHRKKLSEAALSGKNTGENHPFYGKTHSEETRKKLSEANLGKKLSEETRRKMSEAQKGKKLSPESIRKREETKRKKRISRRYG